MSDGKRRAESDARIEYIYSFLSQFADIPRHDISSLVHDGSLGPKFAALFQAQGSLSLLLYHQDEVCEAPPSEQPKSRVSPPRAIGPATPTVRKRLKCVEGLDSKLTGVAVYYIRPNMAKAITEDNYFKEITCGYVPSFRPGLSLETFLKTMEEVYIPILRELSTAGEGLRGSINASILRTVTLRLVPALRSYSSVLRVWHFVQIDPTLFVDIKGIFSGKERVEDLRMIAKDENKVKTMESNMKKWNEVVTQLVSESDRLRAEHDDYGPQDEVEYWKQRASKLSIFYDILKSGEIKFTIFTLQLVRSNSVKIWRNLEVKVAHCFNEAKDNSAYVEKIDKLCHSLYLDEPSKIKGQVRSLMRTIVMIQKTSMYYNTSEKISHLLVKVTNQIIRRCKDFLTDRESKSIWSIPRKVIRNRINDCLELKTVYSRSYKINAKKFDAKPHNGSGEFCISEHYIFGKLNRFCERLKKILETFDIMDGYETLFRSNVCGLLWDDIIEEKSKEYVAFVKLMSQKSYDPLDYREDEFNTDYNDFMSRVEDLKNSLNLLIEKHYNSIWESPQGVKFLQRIKEVNRQVPLTTVDDKYERVANHFLEKIRRTTKIYQKYKRRPKVPRGMPILSGEIMWKRSMVLHLEALTKELETDEKFKTLEQYKIIVKEYNDFAYEVANDEVKISNIWRDSIQLSSLEQALQNTLLKINDKEQFVVNFSSTIETMINEADCLLKMSNEVPLSAKMVLLKSHHFRSIINNLEVLIEKFTTSIQRVKRDVRPILFSQVVRLAGLFHPVINTLTWTSEEWEPYFKMCSEAIDEFSTLVSTVHDVFEYQIEVTLNEMEDMIFCSKFNNLPWELEDFLDRNCFVSRTTAVEFNEKSMKIRDLIDELILQINITGKNIGAEIITKFELNKKLPILAEILESSSPCFSPDQSPANSSTGGVSRSGGNGGYASPGSQRSQPDWSIVDHLYKSPHLIYALLNGKGCKDFKDLTKSATEDVKFLFSKQVFEILVQNLKTTLGLIRRRFLGSKQYRISSIYSQAINRVEEPCFFECSPVFVTTTYLEDSKVTIRPAINQIQECITQVVRVIINSTKGIAQWQSYVLEGHEYIQSRSAKMDQRSALYHSISEKRAGPPHQHYNFYSQVCENKELGKFISSLNNCTQTFKESYEEFMEIWNVYSFLWEPDRFNEVKEFSAKSPFWVEYEEKIIEYHNYQLALSNLCDYYNFGAVQIAAVELKKQLMDECKMFVMKYGNSLKSKYKREMDFLFLSIRDYQRKLDKEVKTIDDVRMVMESLKKLREVECDIRMKIAPIEEAFHVLGKFDIPTSGEEIEGVASLSYVYDRLQESANKKTADIVLLYPKFQKQLVKDLQVFQKDCEQFCVDYAEEGPMKQSLSPREASDRLALFQNRFDSLWRRNMMYATGQELFGLKSGENENIAAIKKELNLLQKLYRLYNDVIDGVSNYYDIRWKDLNVEQINNELIEFQNRCRKLPKGLKEWPAFSSLKKTIDEFNDICPLLDLMSNKAMKMRHWQKIIDVTKYNFEIERDTLCLKDVLDAPLLEFKEDIEDVCISALKERDIEAKLRQVTVEWSQNELTFVSFKNRGELLLRGDTTAETITALEDSLMILGSLLSNRYNAPFLKQIRKWVSDLSNTNEILERWLLVQNMWVYLEAVFVGGDIAKQLPKEAKRFSKIDHAWQKIMHRAHDTPSVVACCVGDDALKQILPHLQDELEICQKSLSGYLEKKRLLFPRFFFVSDPALLEILGQASDSHSIQSHLLSIFDNVACVRFHDTDYNKILEIESSEGECIKLLRPVKAEGSVEVWLNNLLRAVQSSLHGIIREASRTISDMDLPLLELLESSPAQVGILAVQMVWTKDSEQSLLFARVDRKIMPDVNNKFLDLLNKLIDQTTRNLTKIERTKFETLITIHVHQRDIFDGLCRLGVRSASDFEWAKQCRFYFRDEKDITEILITDAYFIYQNEYLGCTDRLVITPLTDRCYITLAQALSLSMGGCSSGPAGTGKTETVKDMGKTLGKYVVVFNCSDQMDYKGLGRIYKGLAQSGSWGCFDEFNRINLPVLSVASQQIAVVLNCKKEKRKSFIFTDGELIDMNPEFGIFLTMNPGYAGRQELPENLKIQFRTVAMMVPDRQIIIRVKLASCGFLENITLARKFYTLYKLCEEQLTKQVHYDFGLRNILSVLRTLGATKRSSDNKYSESTIVMRVLRDMNLSKLIDEDEPLFMSLVSDLFPNLMFDKTNYFNLEQAIKEEAERQGLIFHDPWVLKLIQLFETQQVRHGIMILGPSGAGKTTCIHTLMRALSAIGEPHREMRMNPKAISAHQMFGRLDVATNDWSDGIFSALWRKTLKPQKKGQIEHIWLVLDGPVDSIWIENLNSVLDDNKTLTLANGDRLPMAPRCKIIFEPHNIDNASPATVSRNGMVYMSSSGLNWTPILEAWLNKLETQIRIPLKKCMEVNFFSVYEWSRQNLAFKMQILECHIVFQLLTLLDGLIFKPSVDVREELSEGKRIASTSEETEEEEFKWTPETLKRAYTFSLSWSVGCFLESEDRLKLDHFMKSLKGLDLPSTDDLTVFDFGLEEGEWVLWAQHLESYNLPENYANEFISIMVPTIESVRTAFFMEMIAKQKKAVLLIGEQGCGKTLMIDNFIKNYYDPEVHLSRTMNFSYATSPSQFQRTVESYLEKRAGTTFGPSGGRKMTIFIDDINLPEINEWGDQVTNEIVRQTIEMKGFYSLEKPGEFTHIVDVQFVAAMIHPGAGRNDIPSRLKRHFTILNCPLPTDKSIDSIFSTIALGHYCSRRGFLDPVLKTISKLVKVTRLLWLSTRKTLLPSPAKFHYVFNMRDLSRIWQGMTGTLNSVIDSEESAVQLWIHECTRVITDRFTDLEDKKWFDTEMESIVMEELDKASAAMVSRIKPLFVDFMRDAPEPTGEEGEDADVELPKVYEPIENLSVLKERLLMFLSQYNDIVRGSPMNLVFFPDAMINLIKISRIIRNPGGNALLVGVGGSGKQSLTRLSSFIAGYRTFQITLTRSYNLGNFMEDLKLLYRACGAQGKGTTFIYTDQDIKEEVFLEYLNNVLSSGVIYNLFNRDENSEIIAELTPIMRREMPRKNPTPDNVLNYFIQRVKQHLHVVLCFSPVGEKFRSRAYKFPALISGCTINWFTPWPKEALVAVAEHFIMEYPIQCTDKVKSSVIDVLGSVQDIVAGICIEYFQRLRRSAHVTPKSYLSFLASYKTIYGKKMKELKESTERINAGLSKLRGAAESIVMLKKELVEMEVELEAAFKESERVLKSVEERAEESRIIRNRVQAKKIVAEQLVKEIEVDRVRAEAKLEAAKPALQEAEAALNTIQPTDIATVRKLGRPPHLIMRIMDCVLILFQKRLQLSFPDPNYPCPRPSWPEALKLMASANFLISLQNYPKDMINEEIIELLDPYFSMEDYNMEDAKRVCGDVAGLLSWTKSMAVFYEVNKEVLPLKANLALQEGRLKAATHDLTVLELELKAKETELGSVQEEYNAALMKTQQLTDAANGCRKKMSTAMALIEGLKGENVRWTQQSQELTEKMGRLVGDVLAAASFLSYSGPFNQEYRAVLFKQWLQLLISNKIPHTEELSVLQLMVESSETSEWTLQGLPNDILSIENAAIVTRGASYPLLVDPQSQGKTWIRSKESLNELIITSLNHKYFRTHLEKSLSLGHPLLIEDVEEELDPVLDNVLEKNFIKSGTIEKVIVGDKECDVMPGFMLYMTTKLPNPFFTPEISAKTSIIDFTVTIKGLEDQLLGRVIRMEKSELETERMTLFSSVLENKRRTKVLEDNLLNKLSSSQGSLVEDEELVHVLKSTKLTAEDVKNKLVIAEETEKKINLAREEFRPIASRGSVLYFLVVEMTKVNPMYQTSLKQFLHMFDNSIKFSKLTLIADERLENILNALNWEVWQFVQRSLFEKDRFLFTMLMALKIDLHEGKIKHEEFMTLIKGGASLDLTAVTAKPFKWIPDISWLNLMELSSIKQFKNIHNEVSSHEHEWKSWYELEAPEKARFPMGYEKLNTFRKLLLIRSWCPDRTLLMSKRYISDGLGPEFSQSKILDFEKTWEESEPHTPLLCILSIGSDPTAEIENLARYKSIPLKVVAMGQGQEVLAKQYMTDSMDNGAWLLLQNCHLCIPFCNEIMDLITEKEDMQTSFRLWLTTDCHKDFPISLLHASIKFTNEAPQGIKASLQRMYQHVSQDHLDYTSSRHWPGLLYAVSFLHAIVQERRKFGPLGWNIPYEFNKADYNASVQFIQNHLEELNPKKQNVSWATVCYMLGEVQYGGRVTDDFDKRLLNTLTTTYFNESLLHGHFEFHKGYKAPTTRNLSVITEVINGLPEQDSPEVFGLHPNADITYQINGVNSMFDKILGVQPKESAIGGGETREAVVSRIADDMLKKLPSNYVAFEIREALNKLGALLPMNIFLRQELDRMSKVIVKTRKTLIDLKLAVEGAIMMSDDIRDALDAIYDARVPISWKKISWDSSSIGFWFTELLERNSQFKTWLNKGKPKTYWMTGFFNPQGFLTAMRQEVTRAQRSRGWALDSVVLQNVVTRFWKEDVLESPAEGVYVYGLYVEGASVEKRSGKLIESRLKILYEPVPIVFIFAMNTTCGKDPRLYECPIYRKPKRNAENYIGSIDFMTDAPPRHWVLRGVALLCDIK